MTLTADFENQSAHRLAAHFDPSGARTIGILIMYDKHVKVANTAV